MSKPVLASPLHSPRRPGCKFRLGLVGGMGSGKSEIAKLFAEQGAVVVAGDPLGHEALRDPAIRQQIVARWGSGLLDAQGQVDRRKLAAVVFSDDRERKYLESLSLPYIKRRIAEELARAEADPQARLIVLDAAIMLEVGWDHECDAIVFVEAPRAVRLNRLAQQRGWTEAEVVRREAAQLPLTEKARRADHVIDNGGALEQTRRQVVELLQRLQRVSSEARTTV